jgi:hypothetical protein
LRFLHLYLLNHKEHLLNSIFQHHYDLRCPIALLTKFQRIHFSMLVYSNFLSSICKFCLVLLLSNL